jgi:hypothetical protein
MERKYLITQEQFEQIQHYMRMFQLNSELISDICSSEKDDVVYGFELGKMYSNLRDCFVEMMELEGKIRNQEFNEE